MSKAKTLATTVSTGGVLEDPSNIPAADIDGLATVATSGSYNDLTDKPSSTTTATNIAGGSAGTLPYQSASGTTAMLAAGTSGQLLQSNGAAAPSWITFAAGTNITRTAKTANYTLAAGDKGNLIACTSGTFTLSFTAAATLGSGWCVYLQNTGSGEITLDPASSETIDGLTSYIMYPYESRLVFCDGTSFYSLIITSFYLTYTATSTFTKPPGYSRFEGYLWGAGGGGGRQGNSSNFSGGGGGGACHWFNLAASALGATETVTIGAGGTGMTTTNNNGGTGGTSSFGSLAYAYGGGGGYGSTGDYGQGGGGGGLMGAGGQGSAGGTGRVDAGAPSMFEGNVSGLRQLNVYGGAAFSSYSSTQNPGGIWGGGSGGGGGQTGSGNSLWGGAGGAGPYIDGYTANAGTSLYGGNGGYGNATLSGGAGAAPGGGGGGTKSGTAGGAGARGEIRFWGVI